MIRLRGAACLLLWATTAHGQTAQHQTVPDQTVQNQTAPSQTAQIQTAPSQTAPSQTAPNQTAPLQTAAEKFHPRRGLNFDIWVEWLTTDQMLTTPGFLDVYPDWRRHVTPAAINALPVHGYDFARLPMDPAPLLAAGPGPRQDHLIDQIAISAALVQASGLNVIIDMHSFPRTDETLVADEAAAADEAAGADAAAGAGEAAGADGAAGADAAAGADGAWGVDSILADPAKFAAYTTLIGKIARRLDGMDPTRTAFELMNEPTHDCEAVWGAAAPLWPAQLVALHATARANAPALPLVLSGACWGGAEGLAALDPALINDDNVLWSFHSYTPFLFSHQGAAWTGGLEAVIHHLPYPPTLLSGQTARDLARDTAAWARAQGLHTNPPAIAANLTAAFTDYRHSADGQIAASAQLAATWADAHHIPRSRLLMGEFGANSSPDDTPEDAASRARFVQAKRLSAQALGIGWAVWSWSGSFGVSDGSANRKPDPAICAALGLPCR